MRLYLYIYIYISVRICNVVVVDATWVVYQCYRAERNRQSAAASRERKKRHLKELESRVQYLSEMSAAVQYRSHVDMQSWNEKEKRLEEEVCKLKRLLSEALSDNDRLRNELKACRQSS